MNEARWERVQQVVEEALALPGPERAAFVRTACGDDASLRDEVLSLLAADVVETLPTNWLGAIATPEADRFAPGDRLGGRYVIRALLGRGGMGEVYEADDEELGITVALKTLREAGESRQGHERLELEGLLARAVWHPNVCRVYELARHGELWFLAMERLHGPTLAERLRAETKLPLDRAQRIAEEVGAALGAAHRAGVVHRDLKPGNVMLVERDGAERAVVTDFGTGRLLDSPRDVREVFGTPAYMAPEQRKGEEVGPAADVYAFGLLLHEMITGALPLHRPFRGIDPRWDATIRRCLDPDPKKRFAHAEDVAAMLAGRAPAEVREAAYRPSLPAERDPFVGREADLVALVRAREADARLITLVGTGGMGKTRLATRFAWSTASSWAGGAWFCDLSDAHDSDGIAAAVGGALGVQLGRGDALKQLGHAIAARGACLVVLDNCEQVLPQVASALGTWRALAPAAVFLATSRERLGLDGEAAHAVEPLSTEEGVALFTLRALGLRPGLAFGDADRRDVRAIVERLDGIPLAIELAAARIRVMTVAKILEGVDRRLPLLAGGAGARHETLGRTIDGSWELLTPWERTAWAQCAVFEGGCTLEAATAVVHADGAAPPVLEIVRSLVDKSLLRTWVAPGDAAYEARFGMYVTLQEYARAKLRDGGERGAEERHGAHYARYGNDAMIHEAERKLRVRRRFERELDNLVAACRRAIARGDGPVVSGTYRAASRVLRERGPLSAALTLGRDALAATTGIDRAIVADRLGDVEWFAGRYEDVVLHCGEAVELARATGDERVVARAAAPRGRALFALGRVDEAAGVFELAVVTARRIDDRSSLCAALNGLGMLQHEQGRIEEARRTCEEAVALARALGDRHQEGVGLMTLGVLTHRIGRLDEAGELFEEVLAINRETGARRSEGVARINLGSLRSDQGRLAEARAHAEAASAIAREIGARPSEGIALAVLGELLVESRDDAGARDAFERSIAIMREIGDRRLEGVVRANLAGIDEREGDRIKARAGFEEALAIHREVSDRHYEAATLVSLGVLALAGGALDESEKALDTAEAALRDLDARQELVRLLSARAELAHARGNVDATRAALAEAEELTAELKIRPDSEAGRALARAREVSGAGRSAGGR